MCVDEEEEEMNVFEYNFKKKDYFATKRSLNQWQNFGDKGSKRNDN